MTTSLAALVQPPTAERENQAGSPRAACLRGEGRALGMAEPDRAFPWGLALALCVAMSGVCTNMTVLFPFVPFLVQDLGSALRGLLQ